MHQLKLPKIWRRELMVAIPKPNKSLGDQRVHRPLSLLYVSFNTLERLIYTRVEPIIDPLLPKDQAGFRRGRSTVDQVIPLSREIAGSFLAKKKAGAVFVDLTAACNTVWHQDITCKLLRIFLDRHMSH